MKKTGYFLFLLLTLGMLFNACSTDVDLYTDYKDITVVYGLLDATKDTNYVKINKAFLPSSENGNALNIALIADSCNYPYKLDAKIIEYRSSAGGTNYQKTREMVLDTMTIHNKIQEGYFYAPDQLVYFTKEKVNANSEQYKYKYELQIDRNDTILTAETDMVGGHGFNISKADTDYSKNLVRVWWSECPNAALYEIVIKFRFTEISATNDSVERCMSWSWGSYPAMSLETENGQFIVDQKGAMFFSALASFLGNDTLDQTVDRLIGSYPIGICIAAGGEELYNFITINGPSSSIVQNIPEYTNVKGGYGVFSSRTMKEKWVRLVSGPQLYAHENWRFRQG